MRIIPTIIAAIALAGQASAFEDWMMPPPPGGEAIPMPIPEPAPERLLQTTFCTVQGGLAETIMTARQEGVAMSKLIGILPQSVVGNVTAKMVQTAYDEPRWNTERNQQRAIADFRNLIEATCFRVMMP